MRGRPPGGNERNLSDSLLAAAESRLHEKSHLDLTSREIAETAGTHPGMVNYYFQGKEGLLLTLLDNVADDNVRHLDAIDAIVDSCDDDPTELIVRELIDAFYPHADVISMFFIEVLRGADPIRMFFSQRRDFLFVRMEKVIRKLVAKGIYRQGLDAKATTWMLFSLVIGPLVLTPMCQARDASTEPMPTDVWIDNIVRMLRKELLAQAPRWQDRDLP
jgi:AcrR family transcriptional regulator